MTSIATKIAFALAGLLLLALSPTAFAADRHERIEMAREAAGAKEREHKKTHALAGGQLKLNEGEFLAGFPGQKVKLSVTLQRPTPNATLVVTLPAQWTADSASGLPFAAAPKLAKRAGGRAKLGRATGREVEMTFSGGKAGDVATLEIADVGIPSGTYELPFAWRVGGKLRSAGKAEVSFYAPERESPEQEEGAAGEDPFGRVSVPGIASNGSSNGDENSEVFLAVQPNNADRIVIGDNDNSPNLSGGDNERTVYVTNNGGKRWRKIVMPYYTDGEGNANTEYQDLCCDPAWAADDQGNFWYSLISYPHETNSEGYTIHDGPSRIVVNRIGAGADQFQDYSVGLPARTTGQQDKQMMTVDNSKTSPTYGRVYAVWNEPQSTGGKLNVTSHCDTIVSGKRTPERCDVPENWTRPAPVSDAAVTASSEIYTDIAVGQNGRVYVSWLDYSANNAILASTCDPGTAPAKSPTPDRCASQTGLYWNAGGGSTANWRIVAKLDKSGGTPIPFFCPILAAPGGRVGATPSIEVDRSGQTYNDRVYLSWSDLTAGSGTTKCAKNSSGALASNLTWDSFVASAAGGAIPGSTSASTAKTSAQIGTNVNPASPGTDEFFPWTAVDQSTGQDWVSYYSTKDDPYGVKTHTYARGVTLNKLGKLTRVSQYQSNYGGTATTPNDYGDYEGLDAAEGRAFPVWTDNSSGDGEATTYISSASRPRPGGALVQLTYGAACISQATGDCTTRGRGLGNPQDIAVYKNNAYVANDDDYPNQYGALGVYTRGSGGGLTQLGGTSGTAGCWTNNGEGGCAKGRSLAQPYNVIVSPDGRDVYSLTGYPYGIAAFTRDQTSGGLTQKAGTAGCTTADGTDYHSGDSYPYPVVCAKARHLDDIDKLVISPDGKFVYGIDSSSYTAAIVIFKRDLTSGKLTQLSGTAGCMTPDGDPDYDTGVLTCKAVPALGDNGVSDMVFSADGASAYTTGYRDVLIFGRNLTSGALTNLSTGGCLNENGDNGCLDMNGVKYPGGLAISPDGKQVYVLSTWGAIGVLQRNPTSFRLSQPANQQECLAYENSSNFPYCVQSPSLDYLNEMVVSKDGGTLHAVADEEVISLDRDPVTGALSELRRPYTCDTEDGAVPRLYSYSSDGDCVNVKGLDGTYSAELTSIALSQDDKFAYVTSSEAEDVVNFARTPTIGAPECTSYRQAVAAGQARKIKLLCKDDLGNPITLQIVTGPTKGTLSAIDQASDTVTYTPNAGAVGDDTIKFRGTDGTGTPVAATVYISIS